MDIVERINENIFKRADDVTSNVKGIKAWLEDFEDAYNSGNIKLAKQIIKNISKRINVLKKLY